jgi:hypothetical protein
MLPLLRAGLTLRRSLALAFASDTLSIATMELLDTLIILIVPGAINAGLGDSLFWGLARRCTVHRLGPRSR